MCYYYTCSIIRAHTEYDIDRGLGQKTASRQRDCNECEKPIVPHLYTRIVCSRLYVRKAIA